MTYLRDRHTDLYAGLSVRPVGSRIRLIVAVGLVAFVLAAILATPHFSLSPLSSLSIFGVKAHRTPPIEESPKGPATVGSGTILFCCYIPQGLPPTRVTC